MDLDTVTCIELTISRTNLDSHANAFVVGRIFQMISNTSNVEKVSLFTYYCDSMNQVSIVDDSIIHDNEYTREICTLIGRDNLSSPAIGHNLNPTFYEKVGHKFEDYSEVSSMKSLC